MNYQRTHWENQLEEEDGRIVQEGTLLSARNLNNIEEALVIVFKHLEKANHWITPTLLNEWKASTIATPPAYRKDALGIVHLVGRMEGGKHANYTTLFTLPRGYKPKNTLLFAVAGPARINVNSGGEVQVVDAASNSYLSLAGISFLAEQ